MWVDGFEHLAIALGIIVSALAIRKGVRSWRAETVAAIEQRAKQQEVIDTIAAEFQPRNGRSLAQTVADIDKSVTAHHKAAADEWAANAQAHADIHRRIDGLFLLDASHNTTQAHKHADRHKACKDDEQD
jgi:hypothetical protein